MNIPVEVLVLLRYYHCMICTTFPVPGYGSKIGHDSQRQGRKSELTNLTRNLSAG